MAAIEIPGNAHGVGHSKVKTTRMSTRVDMTPMVDLGFLLITFFMLATTMSKPTSMSVFFPDKKGSEMAPIGALRVLTIFLGGHDQVYYLDGVAPDDDRAASQLKAIRPGYELRNVIFAAHRRVNALPGKRNADSEGLVIVIKPTALSSYKNMVDAMDEMAITKSKRYALVDKLTDPEIKLFGDRILEKK